jgi:two-component system KDP operon response regulator KdpE
VNEGPLVLLVEDDAAMRRFLGASLEPAGWRLVQATTATEGLALAMQYVPDLVLLDLGLPDLEGVEVIRRLRAWSKVPIVVLSARDREREKVAALDAGADDYVTKPFGFAELVARMRAAIRRSLHATAAEPVFDSGALHVDLERREVRLAGGEVHLSPTEYKLLSVLVRHAGRVVTQQQLLEAVWGPHAAKQAHYLRVYMANLRRKLEPERDGRLFATEAGVGYRLRDDAGS